MSLKVQGVGVCLAIPGAIGEEIRRHRADLGRQGAGDFGHAIRAEEPDAPGAVKDLAQLQHAGRLAVDRRHPAQLGLHDDHCHGFRPGD